MTEELGLFIVQSKDVALEGLFKIIVVDVTGKVFRKVNNRMRLKKAVKT